MITSPAAEPNGEPKSREKKISFFSPKEIVNYEPSENEYLVGDSHITRGNIFVIGGQPGVGKSRAATDLAMAGVTGDPWFGLKIHAPFKTMIIQNENGRRRLMKEYRNRPMVDKANESILVSEPPPYGLSFGDKAFKEDLEEAINNFKPDVVIIDPWNATTKDDSMSEYAEAFRLIQSVLPKGEDKPALGIVAHTRKPKSDEKRVGGSGMMHLLSGSHILSSVPRSVFIMVPADELNEADNRVVWFNPKNNDGHKPERSAWKLTEHGFENILTFDWDGFDQGGGTTRITMNEAFIREALGGGKEGHQWNKKGAVNRLMKVSNLGERACEKALKEGGRFSHLFTIEDGQYYLLK